MTIYKFKVFIQLTTSIAIVKKEKAICRESQPMPKLRELTRILESNMIHWHERYPEATEVRSEVYHEVVVTGLQGVESNE